MNHSKPNTSASSKSWWAAVLVGLVVVLAMGAALIRVQDQPAEPRLAVLPAAAEQPLESSSGPVLLVAEPSQPAASANAVNETPQVDQPQIQITDKPRPVLPQTPEPAVARVKATPPKAP
jgi:hypothetical protein